ncbi:hypothetical protein EJB05_25187, partial [Eragrostis curvula]
DFQLLSSTKPLPATYAVDRDATDCGHRDWTAAEDPARWLLGSPAPVSERTPVGSRTRRGSRERESRAAAEDQVTRSTHLVIDPRAAMTGPTEEAPAAAAAASPKNGATEERASPAAAARPRGFWLLGEDKSVHKALGGGKTADVLLWKDTKISAAVIGGATVLWVLFEVVDYHLLTLISHVLIGALVILFLWSNATVFIKKSPPDVPEVQISEDLAVNIALALRADINKALGLLREIAMGHDLMKFLGVLVALWILSEIGNLCDFLTLIYSAVLMLHTVPILYHKYQDKVDDFAAKAHGELCKQYKVLDDKVLSKIPRAPPKDKKQN